MSWISSLLGQDAQHNAGVAQSNSNAQLERQNSFGNQAGDIYGNLNSQGQQGANAYGGQYLPLLNRFGAMAGLGGNSIVSGQPQSGMRQPGAPMGGGEAPFGSAVQPQPAQGGQQDPNNPYSLDQNEQGQLNQQIASLASMHQQALSSTAQALAARGINTSDPRIMQVATQSINEHFARLKADEETKFYDQIKQSKLQALQSLLGGLEGFGKTGIGQQEAAGSGYLGLASGAQNAAAQQQNAAFGQQQLADQGLGGFMHLITQFFPGGSLAGKAGTPIAPGGTSVPFSADNPYLTQRA